MLMGLEITFLDSDFNLEEIQNLIGNVDLVKTTRSVDSDRFKSIRDPMELIETLKNTSAKWIVSLFSSGTTGPAKEVKHTFTSLTKHLKYPRDGMSHVWGLTYNLTHIAGLQVLLQALLNGSTIVRLFGLSTCAIREEISNTNMTHISATPTFFRMLASTRDSFPSISRCTAGGEILDRRTLKLLSILFPNAKINNVYASTETGSLFASSDDVFTVKPEFADQVKILNDELLIHKLLVNGNNFQIDEWYKTGDVIEIVSLEPLTFRFASRKCDTINTGGYKVNLREVESAIHSINGVQDVRVYAKANSVLGHVICCEVVRLNQKLDEASIRAHLKSLLQEHKIPRLINFVDEIAKSRTGKILRR